MSSEILHLSSWARSVENRAIELYEGRGHSARPFLFIGGVHGDEPEGVQLASDFLSWLQKNHTEKLHSWLLIPCINPDGFHNNKRVNSNGVDLNRNFPSADWSPEFKTERYFPGHQPHSEPEVVALCQLLQTYRPEAVIHFHSWEPCVVYTGGPGKAWAEIIGRHTPYETREDIGYPTPGSLGQYAWTKHQIPVICVEAQEKSKLETVWPIFQGGLIDLVNQ